MAYYNGMAVSSLERVSLHPDWLRQRPQDYHHNTRVAFITGNLIPGQVYYKAQKLRAMVRQQVLELLEEVESVCRRQRIEYLRSFTTASFEDIVLRYLRSGALVH